jgi:hypothetical protein
MAGPSISSQSTTPISTQTSGASSPVSSQSKSSPQNANGYQYVTGGNLNLTADPAITGQAFDSITALVTQALAGQNQTAQQVNASATQTAQAINDANGQNQNESNAILASVLQRDQAIGSNTATGGASGTQTTFLWLAGIVVAGAVFVAAIFRRKN